MKFRIAILLGLFLVMPFMVMAQGRTIKSEMDWMHKAYNISFVYDSNLPTGKQYTGPSLQSMPLRKALKTLFRNSGISYELKGNYVLLKGNANVDKRRTNKNTDSRTKSSKQKNPKTSKIKPSRDAAQSTKSGDSELDEIVVNGDLNSPLLATQTGKRTFSREDIMSAFSLASSPDVVKTLQNISGVTTGVELASGLYVHGGDADENLFLLDGSPLYSVNHTMGLFSAFNVDVVKDIDFYKSGFPARYGGRLSSVVDVRTADGDMQHYHGSYRIGLLDGSFHLEGPIRKDKTSFNIGLRRSWIDLLTRPFCAIRNHEIKDYKVTLNYYFHDLNAKVTNIFSDRSRLSLTLYSGEDKLHAKDEETDDYGSYTDRDVSDVKFSWGNFNASLDWQYIFSPKIKANFTAFYTYNRARVHDNRDDVTTEDNEELYSNIDHHTYHSTINDLGYRVAFDYRPTVHHHIRFGADYTWHTFKPQSRRDETVSDETNPNILYSSNKHVANEWNAYAEDEMSLSDKWSLNAGVNASLFHITGKSFYSVDPRFAVKFQVNPRLSFKASVTSMSQYVHKISNTFLELPTDYWVPTTARLHPKKSLQFAAGAYLRPDSHWLVSLEAFVKRTHHLLEYPSWTGLEPPADKWDMLVMDGRGRFYGIEADAVYNRRNLTLKGSYTLSWNKRYYQEFYPSWFYDKFDNRHKINISARWNISQKVSMFAVWTFHSGNHITVPTQYVALPNVPDCKPIINDERFAHQSDGITSEWIWMSYLDYYYTGNNDFIYEKPNNFTLPAYHRLDVGFDFTHKTRKGHEIVWNLSVYNAYCHLNSMYVDMDFDWSGQLKVRNHAYFPIIPSFSYTYKF